MQRLICAEKSKEFVGKTMEVLIDGKIAGRRILWKNIETQLTLMVSFVKTKMNFFLRICSVKISQAQEYDLIEDYR